MTNTVFSPSQTKAWLVCPVMRALDYVDGWRPRVIGKKVLAGVLGTAMAEGVAVYHNALKIGGVETGVNVVDLPVTKLAVETGVDSVRRQLARLDAQGFTVRPEDEPLAMSLDTKVAKGLIRYIAANPIPTWWEILDVERSIPEGGNCRIDLGIRTPMGLAIADVKCKLSLDARYKAKTVEGYRTDWQLRHYCHFYGEAMGAPVRDFYIILVVFEPKAYVEVLPYTVHPEDMQAWSAGAERVWQCMAEESDGIEAPFQNLANCVTSFGQCDMYRACHEFHYDEGLMAREYINTKRGGDK